MVSRWFLGEEAELADELHGFGRTKFRARVKSASGTELDQRPSLSHIERSISMLRYCINWVCDECN